MDGRDGPYMRQLTFSKRGKVDQSFIVEKCYAGKLVLFDARGEDSACRRQLMELWPSSVALLSTAAQEPQVMVKECLISKKRFDFQRSSPKRVL